MAASAAALAKAGNVPVVTLTLSKRSPLLFQPRRIVREQTCRLNLDSRIRKVVTHLLEIANVLSELLPLVGVADGEIECALGEADHLCGDSDTALVQDLDCDLRHVRWSHVEEAGRRGSCEKRNPPCSPCQPPRRRCPCVTAHRQMPIDK